MPHSFGHRESRLQTTRLSCRYFFLFPSVSRLFPSAIILFPLLTLVHERALLATTNQDIDQVIVQDKSLKNNYIYQYTLQDTQQDTPQDTDQVTDQVEQLVAVLTGEMSRASIQAGLELKDRPHFIESYLKPALEAGLIEMTLPDKPTSRHQRYRRTSRGEAFVEQTKGKTKNEKSRDGD